jgi:hypothetical protein
MTLLRLGTTNRIILNRVLYYGSVRNYILDTPSKVVVSAQGTTRNI